MGYFGKWHVECRNDPGAFGLQVDESTERAGTRYSDTLDVYPDMDARVAVP